MGPPTSFPFVQIWKEVGEVSIVFNNAGVRLVRPFVQYTQAQIEKMISVNLMGQVSDFMYVNIADRSNLSMSK